ncbi:hypothetical protein RD110_17640 [Rhodoferax koreense]|uniref:Uncharacterized protein n=1 Tax=Rhodoferax koreensis TaxID=1842727 RepID=A0A1P8JYH4_9BURK|nr:hypothetical protein [Rhodoferax koreense]APW38806.1 hypothetical protein RD110_17640 [Rhodoferax koreense]
MRSFLSPSPSHPSNASTSGRARPVARPARSFWHKQSGAVGVFGGASALADAEAAQRALLYRSEAFAEDLGPGYADMRFAAQAPAAARR